MTVNDLELMNNVNILLENKIIFYGASVQGKIHTEMLNDVKIDIMGYCDSDSQKWGTEFLGKKVFSLDELVEIQDENTIIVITSNGFKEIINNFEKNYDIKCRVYTYFGLRYCLFNNSEKLKNGKEFNKNFKMWYNINQNNYGYIVMHVSINAILNVFDEKNVLVLQPGKVGSSSIRESIIINSKNEIKPFHIHGFECVKDEIKDYLEYKRKTKKVKIITLFREPILRDMSILFQKMGRIFEMDDIISEKLEDYYFNFLKRQYCCEKIPEAKNLYQKWSSSTILGGKKRNQYGYFGWFDTELKNIFDIDILKYKFDQEKGFMIVKENNVEILLLKLEKLDNLEKVIGDFIQIDDFKLIKDNNSEDKIYKYTYDEFKKCIKLPREYVDLYYRDNKYMDYFYSNEEKEKFYSKWEKFIV